MALSRVLIPGGAGFIGSHLAELFCASGAQVRVLDNLRTGARANFAGAAATGGLTFTQGDVIDGVSGKADLIVNLACPASPAQYRRDPVHTMQTCVTGTINLARSQ